MFTKSDKVEVDLINLRRLALQSAATVLFICENRAPDARHPYNLSEEHDPIMIILGRYVNWADNGFTNALQSQTELVYDFVQLCLEEDNWLRHTLSEGEKRLLCDALTAYQAWKTELIAADKAEMGPGYERFGDATDFNKKNWAELNDLFYDRSDATA